MITRAITEIYQNNRNTDKSHQMTAYMRGQFAFYGIPSPTRKQLSKEILKLHARSELSLILTEVEKLWSCEEREVQYFAMELLDKHKRKLTVEHLSFGEGLVTNKSWWDTVDYLSTHFFAPILVSLSTEEREKQVLYLAGHTNMWMNRVAMIFQLSRKQDTETNLLEIAILPHLDSKEFFHQKAIGWALRQYSKVNPAYVKSFLEHYELPKLSVREASKYL